MGKHTVVRPITVERTNPVGILLTQSRNALKLTQERVSAESGIAKGTYTEIERGTRKLQPHHVARLAAVLQINPHALMRTAGIDTQEVSDIGAALDRAVAVNERGPKRPLTIPTTRHGRKHPRWTDPQYWAGIDAELNAA